MDNQDGQGGVYISKARNKQSLGKHEKPLHEYDDNRLKIATDLPNAYQSMGGYQKAIEYQEKQLKIAREIDDRAGERRAYENLGNV